MSFDNNKKKPVDVMFDITRREKVLVSKVIDEDDGVLYSILSSDLLSKDDAINAINKIDKEIRNVSTVELA